MRDKLLQSVGKGHLSYSSLKYALGDMRLWEMYMRGQLRKESDALTFGGLYDTLLFEPDKAKDRYLVMLHEQIMDEMTERVKALKNPKSSSEYKAVVQDMKAEAIEENKTVVTQEDWDKACDMIKRLETCGLLDSYLKGEYQVEFNEDLNGIPVKGFLDCLGSGFITDSKSSRGIGKFRWDVNSFSYDIQAYIYTKVFDVKDYYWVVQEKVFPYYPALVKCSEETLFKGEMKFYEAVENITKWLDNGGDTEKDYAEFIV